MNTDFQRIENPYIIGNPVRGSQPFFGREGDFAYLEQRLRTEKDGVVLLFVGGRRSGKTSIMFQILDGRLGEGFMPVFVDMQQLAGIHGDNDFLARVGRIIVEAIDDDRLVLDYYDFTTGNPILVLDALLADVAKIHENKRLLFLIDEAEILRDKVDRSEISAAVLTYMASVLESRAVSFCLTGSAGLADADVQEWRRLLGKGDYREISFLNRDDTMRLAQEPLGDSVEYDDGVKEAIYELTYGHPFYTQLICTNAVDLLNGEMRNRMTTEDLDEVVRTIVNNPPPQLVYDWDQFDAQEQLALSLLSEVTQAPHTPVPIDALVESIKENSYPIDMGSDTLNMLLDGLDEKKVVERADDAAGYHFLVDLVRMWIRRNRSIWRLVEEGEQKPAGKGKWIALAGAAVVVAAIGFVVSRQSTEDAVMEAEARARLAATPTSGSLLFSAYPEGTQISVRGPLDDERQQTVSRGTPTIVRDRRAGPYEVIVEHPLYATVVDTIVVAAGADSTLRYDLQRLQGEVTITATPVTARIRLQSAAEDIDTTTTSPFAARLNSGTYTMDVRQNGYVTQNQSVVVAAEAPVVRDISLQANVGRLSITSTPPGARILLDGRDSGQLTPATLQGVAVGSRRVRLELEGHDAVEQRTTIRLDETASLDIDLAQTPALLSVQSEPPGAEVFFDGSAESAGRTPFDTTLSPGDHEVRLVLSGYEDTSRGIKLGPGEQLELPAVALTQQFGWVKILRPFRGRLIVDDGEQDGKEGFLGTVRLSVGQHKLEIEGRGVQNVEIPHNDTIDIQWQ